MHIGKVPNSVLKNIILNKIRNTRSEVILRPKIGEDCSAIDFGENICVVSSDPITGAVNEVGRLAVHVSCNDIASSGVEPIGMLVDILAPPNSTEKDLDLVMSQICETAGTLNVDIIGGHTEVTDAVNRFVIIGTAMGKSLKSNMVTTSGAKENDDIVLTKSAGMEGTAIIACDHESKLIGVLGKELIDKAKTYINNISVVKEGIIAGKFGVNSMHDVTEGGVLGAVWEVAEASNTGAIIFKDKISIERETEEICGYFDLNPLKLISSGCMLITCSDGEKLVRELQLNNIKASVIGKITKDQTRFLFDGNHKVEILQPDSDELYKVK